MKDQTYWKRYVRVSDSNEIDLGLRKTTFFSEGKPYELIYFEKSKDAPNIVISQGSGGHAYVFAELAYLLHLRGFNVFVMPKHGPDFTIDRLVRRHEDAIKHIAAVFSGRIGTYSEGLGSFAIFYLALGHGPVKSIICQNGPAVLTEPQFHDAAMSGRGVSGERTKRFFPLLKVAAKLTPGLKLPISLYLDWRELIDTKSENREIEEFLVDSYLNDPDFDRRYTLRAIVSQMTTSPPNPLAKLQIPTMFMISKRGWSYDYPKNLFERLPPIRKKAVEVDGSVYWMLSHPREAADEIEQWFKETL